MEYYQCRHLLQLVGSNPLPNAVAGILLTTSNTTITLLHSAGSFDVALRLRTWLKTQGRKEPRLKQIDESDPAAIFSEVRSQLQAVAEREIGLNYTGGTKAMSVHSYRAIEQWTQEQRGLGYKVKTVFSYLNARNLKIVIDPADPLSGESPRTIPAGLEPKLALTDLLDLHGWSLKHQPNRDPVLPESARALAKACAEKESFMEWDAWVREELRGKCRDQDRDKWKEGKHLPKALTLPVSTAGSPIHDAIATFRTALPLLSEDLELDQPAFAQPNDKQTDRKSAKRFCEWLGGKWLEHYVLDELNRSAASLNVHQQVQNVEANEVQFDVDVIALRGYQLFALSCSTDATKALLKSKLFEAYVRARQLGGDEARVALVCCSNQPEAIELEMRRDVDPEGRIRVFGQPHFANFATHLTQWIEDQSKGV